MPRYDHQPLFDQVVIVDVPPDDAPGSRPLVIRAPCVCGPNHDWEVPIPPSEWRTTIYFGPAVVVDLTDTSQDHVA